MTYVTLMKNPKPYQLKFEDVLLDRVPANALLGETKTASTITRKYESVPPEITEKINVERMITELKRFNMIYEDLQKEDLDQYYHSFKIPKKTGGWRQIDEPLEPLKSAQKMLCNILQNVCGGLYHTSAFAYIENRCTFDAVQKHKNNESNWFLHTDFSGFFPSTTLEFVMRMFSMIFPFSELIKNKEGEAELKKALKLGFKNNGLIQGSPLSPALTNMMFIPIDFELNTMLSHRKLVYTRYADDINVSGQECFPWKTIVNEIEKVLTEFGAVYKIKPEKTHFGNRKGRNWMLGLMLNADNNITVGYRRKNEFKCELANFILDVMHGKDWPIEDVRHLSGELSYFKMVGEEEYFNNVIARMNKKWGIDAKRMLKEYPFF